jgi:hypothetical protein
VRQIHGSTRAALSQENVEVARRFIEHRRLPQPHGIEGLGAALVQRDAHDLAVPDCPDRRGVLKVDNNTAPFARAWLVPTETT